MTNKRLGISVVSRVATLASRYGSLAIQFVLVILVARCLPQADAGTYLLVYSAVITTSVFAGLGSSDALVLSLPRLIESGRSEWVRPEFAASFRFTVLTSVAMVAAFTFGGVIVGYPVWVVVMFGLWWISYATIFYCGQALVALRRPTLGAFCWYALNSLLLLISTMPYLLLQRGPTAFGTLAVTVGSAFVAAAICVAFVTSTLTHFPRQSGSRQEISGVLFGVVIAASRTIQASLYWVPAWAIAFFEGPAVAAVVSTAGRLLIAATAVIAAFRFTIRSSVVAAAERGDWPAIERMSRAAATIATSISLLAILVVGTIGRPVIGAVFGPSFAASSGILFILLFGALAESVGGPVDEVLRFSGHSTVGLVSLIVTITVEALLAISFGRFGPNGVAIAQALAFAGLYGFLIWYCRWRHGILILPYLSLVKLKGALRSL